MADDPKGPEGAGQDAPKAIPSPAAGGEKTTNAPISSTAQSPQNKAGATTQSAAPGAGVPKGNTNPQGQAGAAPQGAKTAEAARTATQQRESAAAGGKAQAVKIEGQKLTSNDIETQEAIAQASGRSVASPNMTVDMIKKINAESRELQKAEEKAKEAEKEARQEFDRQRKAISSMEARTIPGAPSMSPKSHMLDARDVAAKHPDKYLRWVNLRDGASVGVRKAEGYQELGADQGGQRLGDDYVLMYLPKSQQERKQAAQRARTRQSFEAPNKDFERQVDEVARALRDKYDIRLDEREMRKGLEGD